MSWDKDGNFNGGGLSICRGVGVRFYARTRGRGYRRWLVHGKPTRSYKIAVMRMAKAFAEDTNTFKGDVIMTADYYDPVVLCELTK